MGTLNLQSIMLHHSAAARESLRILGSKRIILIFTFLRAKLDPMTPGATAASPNMYDAKRHTKKSCNSNDGDYPASETCGLRG